MWGPHSGGLAGPGVRPPGAFGAARGGTPAARSDAPGSRSCRLPSRHRALPRRMPRAPPGLLLLLMAALAFAATPPLEIINPWLSACDLQPNSTDMQGACSAMWAPGGSLCPLPCPANSTTHQCLRYLTESHKEEVCGRGSSPERRKLALQTLHMRHCCEHAVLWALPMDVLDGGDTCRRRIDALLEVDVLAANVSCKFSEVLTRYDCGQTYSIVHRCENCKVRPSSVISLDLTPRMHNLMSRIRTGPHTNSNLFLPSNQMPIIIAKEKLL